MYKAKQFYFAFISVLILSIFAGCKSQNATIPTEPYISTQPTNPTELTNDSMEPTDELIEPTDESTEPTSETTEPTETVCLRTIEYFKSHLTPFMTYGEAIEIFGRWDKFYCSSWEERELVWYLEDDYYVAVYFFSTEHKNYDEHLSGGTSDENRYPLNMGAYRAKLCKKHPYEIVEVWFDYGEGPI